MKLESRYDSRYNSEYKQRIQETVEFILSKSYGATIYFEELAKMLHYNIEDEKGLKKFKSTMARIKSFLIDYGYILKSISGIGYYILKPNQISGHCYRTYVNKSRRLLDKSENILEHTDKTELDEVRTEEYRNMLELNKSLIKGMEEIICASGYYLRKNYYDSLES
jgi:hypothetical protein